MKAPTKTLLSTMIIAALAVMMVTVEALRTDRWELDSGGLADAIPDGFYGDSFLPDAVLDNAGWILAAGIVWIVAAALLVALTTARPRATTAPSGSAERGGR